MARKRKTNLKKVKRTQKQIGGLNQSSLDPRKQPPRMPPEDDVVIGSPVPPGQPKGIQEPLPSVNLPPEVSVSQPQQPPVGS